MCVYIYLKNTKERAHTATCFLYDLSMDLTVSSLLEGKDLCQTQISATPSLRRKRSCKEKDGAKKAKRKIPFFIHAYYPNIQVFMSPHFIQTKEEKFKN